MNVTVTAAGARQHVSTALAVAVVAAGLRAGHAVTVHDHDDPIRWALTTSGRTVTAHPVNPDLFAPDPPIPAWVERIAASAADLL